MLNYAQSIAAPVIPSRKETAPADIWNNWHTARTTAEGRAAIARHHIFQHELSDWPDTPAVRQGEIDLVLRPFARKHL